MELKWNDMCFGCGKKNDCGLKLNVKGENGKVWADVVFKKHHQGWENIVHGGVITAAIDEVMAYALGSLGIMSGVTAELKIRFKKPVIVGESYIAKAEVIESKGRKHTIHSWIEKDGKVFAEGIGIYVTVKEVKT